MAVVGTQLGKELLGLIGESGITAQLRAGARGRPLPRQKPNQLIRISSFELFGKPQENMLRNFVWPKVG